MKNFLLFGSLLFVLTFVAFAGDSRIAAQEPQMTGGYSDSSIRDKDVKNAANFAVKQRSRNVKRNFTLVSIRRAEIQVVAGLNYRLCMRVRDNRGRLTTVTAIVYKNLKNRLSLSNWRGNGCRDN